jgi:hypothetical protein
VQTILTAIGTYVGGQFGYPQLGAFLGALAGSAIQRGMMPDQEYVGPRIADLRVIGLEYGDARAFFKGALPLPGQLDWSTDRRAIPITQTQEAGKGGGPTSTSTTFAYEVDARFGFGCNEAAGVSRVWLNGTLSYNVREDASDGAVGNSMRAASWRRMTFYSGDTAQLPDPAEEADKGVGNAPAYVGGPSIVFEGLQCPGGNMPNVVAELFTKGTAGGAGYQDPFNDELDAHYAPITGSLGAFTRSSGDYGQTVLCPSRSSVGVSDDIRRTVPQSSAIGIRFKFRVGTPTDEDAGEIYFNNAAGSSNRFFFCPRREIAIDAAGRPRLIVSGTTFLLGSVALDPGWYQFHLAIDPGVNNGSTVLIQSLPDEATVVSTSLTGTFNALDIGTQGFYMDSTVTDPTTEAEFADLYVLPARAAIQDETLEDVVEALLLRAGLQASQFDVSALATITTPVTMAISQVTSTRQVIEILAAHYFFDVVESDKLYFRPKGGASVVTIPYEDLGASNQPGGDDEPLTFKPTSELELPGTWVLTYMNLNSDCAKDSQQSDRLGSVSRTVQAVESPLGFTEEQAKAIVDTWRDMAMVAAMGTGAIRLTTEHTALEPGDPFTVTDRDGSTYRVVAPKIAEDNGVRIAEVVFDDANVLTQAGITSTDYTPSSEVNVPGNTVMRILDIPLLRDADNGVGLYGATRGESTSHPGSVVFKSVDDTLWEQKATVTESAVLGSALTQLGDWTGGNVSDEGNVVTVNVGPGTLSSITHAAMVDDGGNLCVIGDEVLQFRTASMVSAGVYILSGLLRGRNGTEWAMGTHVAGERFVLLQTTGLRRISMDAAEVGGTRYWRGVTVGRTIDTAPSQSAVFGGVSSKPLSPVTLRVTRDGSNNITFAWDRRSRLSASFDAYSLPLGEAVEAYRVRVYSDGTFATVEREFAITTTASQAYSAADQTADFGSAQNPVHWRVAQISDTVGEGYTAEASN